MLATLFSTLVTLFPDMLGWLGSLAAKVSYTMVAESSNLFIDLFNNTTVRAFLIFLSSWGSVMFIVGVGLSLAECASNYKEGQGIDFQGTFKNIFLGLFASFGFVTIPILLYRFTMEATKILVGDSIDASIKKNLYEGFDEFLFWDLDESITNVTPDTARTELQTAIIGPIIISILAIVMACFIIKILLGNLKRSGILIILLTVCPIHLLSIPRGYTDAFYSWCKQVVGQCLTFFIQNFMLTLSMLFFANSSGITIVNMILSISILLAASEAPRILQQFGLESSVRTNATQAIYAASGITNIVRTFAH